MTCVVYQHKRNDTNEIFYIGIGTTEHRAYSKHGRNTHWKNIVNKVGYSVEIITTCDIWSEACQIEQYLIKYYGRKDLNTGILVNKTDGGEGFYKGIHSNETKLKIANTKKGCISPNKGIKMMDKQKVKISISKRNNTPNYKRVILDTQTGVFYNSITEASEAYCIKRTTLNAMLKGQNTNKTNLIII